MLRQFTQQCTPLRKLPLLDQALDYIREHIAKLATLPLPLQPHSALLLQSHVDTPPAATPDTFAAAKPDTAAAAPDTAAAAAAVSQALEKDLEDLKAQVLQAQGLQEELSQAQAQLAAARSQQQQLKKELEESRERVSQLEYDVHGELAWSGLVMVQW
jgi:hypothetical protein